MEIQRNYEMTEKERILRRYLDNPLYDDTDLYYNGLIDSTECLDHRSDKSYKTAVFNTLMSRWVENKELGKQVLKKPCFPVHVPKCLRSPNRKFVIKTQNQITAVDESQKNPCDINTTKQPELLLLPEQNPGKGFQLNIRLGGNIVFSVARSYAITVIPENPPEKKQPNKELGSKFIRAKKRKFIEYEPPTEKNIPARLKACYDISVIPENPQKQKQPNNEHESDFIRAKKTKVVEYELRTEKNIPVELKARLQKENAILVIKKSLTATDINTNNSRLAIPESQILDQGFLTEEEIKWLSERDGKAVRHMYVRLIDPSGEEHDIKFARWLMGNNVVYNLLSPWKQVVAENKLRENTPIEVYSFRKGSIIYFAVIKV